MFWNPATSQAGSSDTLYREFTLGLEIRPRLEYRDNFIWSDSDPVMPGLDITQRNRITLNYQADNLRLHASPQEIHVWTEDQRFSGVGSINFFELYAEPVIGKHISVRVGRQALSLDNGRIFSAAPWAQQGRSHEAIRLFYKKKIETDMTFAFTRPYDKRFDSSFSPVASHTYKFLLVYHLKHRLGQHMMLTTINAMDMFSGLNGEKRYFRRFTSGGRLEYTRNQLYGTLNAYYQYGEKVHPGRVRAYYLQPEIGVNINSTVLKAGAEIMSGNKNITANDITHSFEPLYGVAWKFMGNMNFFTRFPIDVKHRGLVNPYLFVIHRLDPNFALRCDTHLFFIQNPLPDQVPSHFGRYLGFEADLSFNYKPAKVVEINYGLSFSFTHQRMELLGKVKDSGKIPVWSYLMVSYAPRLVTRKWIYRVRSEG